MNGTPHFKKEKNILTFVNMHGRFLALSRAKTNNL